ncbi:molybdopterin-containing oxidoreductase family protein [Halobaculum magnesiiphilum]|uniref:Molybdopterin-dependent oxidoreductase n=1 Tax=Halobaculum magnesiiphilum TaxID=1017351 RepID=A0A8T8WIJ2_9EURY|nr:molybdopterin-dependent oxidoreductase [Halobaculum magnesiiphilum]QZP39658.1 molybdopterin-dependent oxidoreductase [Halobaculum magnesiiphilum]
MELNRRDFVKAAAAGTVSTLVSSGWAATQSVDPVTSVDNPLKSYPNRDWEEVYHDIYAYDRVDWTVCHPNCTQSCALNFYMKNGVPIRAEQIYHEEEGSPGPGSPGGYEEAGVSRHWNPRGCMKGLTLHRRTFEPSRIKYPLVRKGWDPDDPNPEGRGSDEFERVSWDEALDLIAEKMASLEDEKRFHVFNAIKADGLFTRHGSARRLASIFGGCEWTEYDWYADLPPGHVMTTGYQTSDSDASAWRAADYTIMQGKNLIHNKLADNHWLQETRERGGKMVGIYPDYSPTVQKCDRWLPVRPGSDPAVPLAFAHVVIDEELYDEEFMRGYTSLPLLVREDSDKYLRAHEVFEDVDPPEGGVEKEPSHHIEGDWGRFVVLGEDGDLHAVDRESVGEETPETARLEVESEVSLADGSTVEVRSDFARQKANVMENYAPETVEEITTVPAEKLRQTAREFAAAERAQWFTGEGINHWFYGASEVQRGIFLVQAMLGNIGERGAGYYNYSGQYKIELLDGYPTYVNPDGNSAHGIYPGHMFAFFGGETLDPSSIRGDYDGDLVAQDDLEEPLMPEGASSFNLHRPEVLWTMNCNLLNQTKHQEHVMQNFVTHPDTANELFVVSDMHMTYSARYADIVLPVPSWLECEYPDITVGPENPFVHMDSGVMEPIYDTKQDGEIVARVAEKLDEKIPPEERNVDSFRDYFAEFLDDDGDVTNYIQEAFDAGTTTQGIDVADLRDGPERLKLKTYPRVPFYSQVHDDRPFYTKTGRMEFHKEEDRLIELGRDDIHHYESVEGTPYDPGKRWDEAKDGTNDLFDDGNRFHYNTPHPKYRTHSSWGMTDWNLIWSSRDFGSTNADPEGTERLVEDFSFPTGDGETNDAPPLGEPFVEMHPSDAADVGVETGDYVRISGERGSMVVRVMVSERQRPTDAGDVGQLTIWHGWWDQQFPEDEEAPDKDAHGYNVATNIWLDPLLESDGMVHKPTFGDPNVSDLVDEDIAWQGAGFAQGYEEAVWAPTGVERDTLVEVEKYEEADWRPADARKDDLVSDYIDGSLQTDAGSDAGGSGGDS